MFRRVGVLMGGLSREREISIKTGEAIYSALKNLGYDAVKIIVDKDFVKSISSYRIDVAFIALHGKYGEDGVIQAILKYLGIPFTGAGVLGSALGMDKVMAKRVFKSLGIDTPKFWKDEEEIDDFPVVVKPVSEGSTIGVYVAKDRDELKMYVKKAKEVSDSIFFEKFIKGRELTASVLCGDALPLIEIKPEKGFYDYESKYTPGKTEYIVPAEVEDSLSFKIKKQAELIFREFGARGAMRVDYILDGDTPYALEVNTIPGMTPTSLLPKAAKACGMSFEEVVERILLDAGL